MIQQPPPTPHRQLTGQIYTSKRYMHPYVHSSAAYNSWDTKISKRPSTDTFITKTCYSYTLECWSATKKNELMPLAVTSVDLEIITASEVSHTKANITWYGLYAESKNIQMNLFTKQKQTQTKAYHYQRKNVEWRDKLVAYMLVT